MSDPADSLRERKRRDTHRRITEAGVALFVARGFDGTTLDEIAAAAGISRRTFFHYFRSKDEILLALQSGMGERITRHIRDAPASVRPMAAVRDAAIAACAAFPAAEMIVIDRIMRASATVQARKQASYLEHEEQVFAALVERWPDPARASGLRLVAMLSMGIVRLATETFHREEGARPLVGLLQVGFDAADAEFGTTGA